MQIKGLPASLNPIFSELLKHINQHQYNFTDRFDDILKFCVAVIIEGIEVILDTPTENGGDLRDYGDAGSQLLQPDLYERNELERSIPQHKQIIFFTCDVHTIYLYATGDWIHESENEIPRDKMREEKLRGVCK